MSVYRDQAGNAPSSNTTPWHRWQDWVNLILGIWLFIAPWFWPGMSRAMQAARSDAWIIGVIVIIMALWALTTPDAQLPEWINTIAGIWLFISPWALGFAAIAHAASWTSWIIGIIVFFASISAAREIGRPSTISGRPVTGM